MKVLPSYLLHKGATQQTTGKKEKQDLFPVLYAMTKNGNVKWYAIEVHHFKSHSEIHRTHAAKIGGKSQTDISVIESGTNIGKANETTIYQQAMNEANSIFEHEKDKGYKLATDIGLVINNDNTYTINTITNNTDKAGRIKPMLACEDHSKIIFPCTVQPKINGHRGMAERTKNDVFMTSREGKPIYNDRIKKYLMLKLKPGEKLDGEMYCHGKSLQDIASICRTEGDHPDKDKLIFVVFDIPIMKMPWGSMPESRLNVLRGFEFPGFNPNYTASPVTELNTRGCPNQTVLEKYHKEFLKMGFEGTIIRNYKGLYEAGFRSHDLIKMKEYDEEEFEITGANEATGRDAGSAVFICKTKKGIEFNCRPQGTLEQRKKYFRDRKKLIGKKLIVQFRGYTSDGKPFQPTGVEIKSYI